MYDASTSITSLSSFYYASGAVIAAAITVILGALAGLLGLGFAVRHAKKHVTGKKF